MSTIYKKLLTFIVSVSLVGSVVAAEKAKTAELPADEAPFTLMVSDGDDVAADAGMELGDIRLATSPLSAPLLRPSRWDRFKDMCQEAPGFVLTNCSAVLSQIVAVSTIHNAVMGDRLLPDEVAKADAVTATVCSAAALSMMVYNLRKYNQPFMPQIKKLVREAPAYALTIGSTLLSQAAVCGQFVDWASGTDATPEKLYTAEAFISSALNAAAIAYYVKDAVQACRKKDTTRAVAYAIV